MGMPTVERLAGPRSTCVGKFYNCSLLRYLSVPFLLLHIIISPFQDLVHDSAFVPFRLQHTVAVHLWLRLFVYRSTGSPMTSTMSYHVEEACNVLCGLIPNSPTETNPKTKRSPVHAKKSPKEDVPAKKPTRTASVRTTNKARAQNPVTPRPRKGLFFSEIACQLYQLTKVARTALENVSNPGNLA